MFHSHRLRTFQVAVSQIMAAVSLLEVASRVSSRVRAAEVKCFSDEFRRLTGAIGGPMC